MPMTPREMMKHLKKNGFTEISQNGSHVKLKIPQKGAGAGNPETGGVGIICPLSLIL